MAVDIAELVEKMMVAVRSLLVVEDIGAGNYLLAVGSCQLVVEGWWLKVADIEVLAVVADRVGLQVVADRYYLETFEVALALAEGRKPMAGCYQLADNTVVVELVDKGQLFAVELVAEFAVSHWRHLLLLAEQFAVRLV